jgi:hypothetical protein
MDFRLLDRFLMFICQQQQASKRCFFECDRDVLGLHSSMSLVCVLTEFWVVFQENDEVFNQSQRQQI